LGLSTQVPARWEYFTDGPAKKYLWSGGTLLFTHRAIKETSTLSSRTALLVQALKTLGADQVDEQVLANLRKQFTAQERTHALRETQYVTAWVYAVIKRLAAGENKPHA